MVTIENLDQQLARIRQKRNFLVKPEIQELAYILNNNETIYHSVLGFYKGATALLVATDQRLLIIDKRPFFLNLEDIRYEMINQVDFAGRLLDASLNLHVANQLMHFRSLSDARLRKMCSFVQDQITVSRQFISVIDSVNGSIAPIQSQPLSPLMLRKRISKFY